jgi:hypothetical protein
MIPSAVNFCRSLVIAAFVMCLCDSAAANTDDTEAAYTREITKRADKIVAPLGIGDESRMLRVRDLVANQYRGLRKIHDARDATIDSARKDRSNADVKSDERINAARDAANLKLSDAHRRFVARLSVELDAEQIEKVKDGMTYGVVPITYKRYLELLPDLNGEQKREILAALVEAREYAMDAGSSEEKHAVFNKYKGRINNYLSAAGYDLKRAEKDLAEKQRGASRKR